MQYSNCYTANLIGPKRSSEDRDRNKDNNIIGKLKARISILSFVSGSMDIKIRELGIIKNRESVKH